VTATHPATLCPTQLRADDLSSLIKHIEARSGGALRPFCVAIDGRSGSGKSTLARRLAKALGAALVDGDGFSRAARESAMIRPNNARVTASIGVGSGRSSRRFVRGTRQATARSIGMRSTGASSLTPPWSRRLQS